MPGGNRKGPLGDGPQTGRGLGYCAGYDEPGYIDTQTALGLGRGFRWGGRGRGAGRGRGRRNRFNAGFGLERGRRAFTAQAISPEQEAEALKAQAAELQDALQEIQKRLDQMEA